MYEERKGLPIKLIIIISTAVIFLGGLIAIIAITNGNKEKAYKKLLADIEKAGIEYGRDNLSDLKVLNNMCVTLDELLDGKYITSSKKNQKILINPKTKKALDGEVYVVYDKSDVYGEYKTGSSCIADYTDIIALTPSEVTTNSIKVTVEVPERLKAIKYEFCIDEGDYFDNALSNMYVFSALKTGEHIIKSRITDYKDEKFIKEYKVNTLELPTAAIVYNEETSIATITYPENTNNFVYDWTVDGTKWNVSKETIANYTFTEDGYIIARLSDGVNTYQTESLPVKVKPACENTEWTPCTGCDPECDGSCEGTQTSNCGEPRTCTIYGKCIDVPSSSSDIPSSSSSSKKPPIVTPTQKYSLTITSENGSVSSKTVSVTNGKSYSLVVNPNTGYVYSSVSCDEGNASYSTSTNKITATKVNSDRTCTVYFTKEEPSITTYVVKFFNYDNTLYKSVNVKSGETISNPGTPTRNGYTFNGWTLNGTAYNFNREVTSNLSLMASYKSNMLTVTFKDGASTVYIQNVNPGETVEPRTSTKSGYYLLGWKNGSEYYNFNNSVNQNLILTADWVKTYVASHGESSSGTYTYTINNLAGVVSVSLNNNEIKSYSVNGKTISVTITKAGTIAITYY